MADDRSVAIPADRPRAGGRVYVVREGDTLFDIARSQLGKATRWADIYELNRDQLGRRLDSLTPGTRLTMPDDQGTPGRVTERGENGFQR
jgi:nucleoid-associated protein YgaU